MQPSAAPPGLVSGEGVRLDLSTAGVASRTIAAAIDAAIQAAAILILVLLDVAVAGSADSAAATAVIIVEAVLVLAGYPVIMEWTTRGRTVGKLCLGLRVVRDDGGPIAFRQALVRGLSSLVLEKPGLMFPLTTVAGLVTLGVSRREKRIGDHMAGTVVLNERAAPQALATPPNWVPPPLQHWVLSLDLHRLDDRLALRMRQFVSRAHEMSYGAQVALGDDLLRQVLAVVSPAPPHGAPTPAVLTSILAERRRRALAAVAPAVAPAAPVAPPAAAPSPWARPESPPPSPDDSPFAPPG